MDNQSEMRRMKAISNLISDAENETSCGRHMEACRFLLQANNLDQMNLTVFLKLAHNYLILGNLVASHTCYYKVIQEATSPLLEEAWFGFAELLFAQCKFADSESAYSKVLELSPNFECSSSIYLRLGIISKKLKKIHKAIGYFQLCGSYRDLKLTQLNELVLQLASCFIEIGNNRTAFEILLEGKDFTDSQRNIICLSWAHLKNGNVYKAQFALTSIENTVLKFTKEFNDIQLLKALCYIRLKKYLEASVIMDTILKIYPNEPYYLAECGILQDNMNNYPLALQYLWKAFGLFPEWYDILYNIGKVYEKIGSRNEASYCYTRISEFVPEDQQAKIKSIQCLTNDPDLSPLDLINIDITEFPFHKQLKPVLTESRPNIIIPQPIYAEPSNPNQIFHAPIPIKRNF